MKCAYSNCEQAVSDFGKRGKIYCGRKCKLNDHVTRNRRKWKQRAVELLGGKCVVCGYNKCVRALHFHHLRDKEFSISDSGCTRSWKRVEAELQKCILLCSNCHAEQHQLGCDRNLVTDCTVNAACVSTPVGSSPTALAISIVG